jgi:3-oxoacyl-[acyl-carrier protein] reductase
MLLENKVAVVYGGGGFVGRAVAEAFAREGARLFLAGRTLGKLDEVSTAITKAGWPKPATAQLDVLAAEEVDKHADAVAAEAGGIDICFNAVSPGSVQGAPLLEMPFDGFARPVTTALCQQFYPVRAIARHMVKPGSGVIMTITGHGAPFPNLGGTSVAWRAVEELYRQWACELGPAGVRVAWLRTSGFRESILGAAAYEDLQMIVDGKEVELSDYDGEMTPEQELDWLANTTMLRRLPSLAEAGEAAAFLASGRAASLTATAINLTAGAMAD